MYIVAMLFKIPICFVLTKAHIKLGEEIELSKGGGSGISSPIGRQGVGQKRNADGGYDQNSPYDPAPVDSSSFSIGSPTNNSTVSATDLQLEMTEMSPAASRLPSPPGSGACGRTPPIPPG
jgi:hypothetical protein